MMPNNSAEAVGQGIGYVFVLIIAVIAIVANAKSMRRPRTNTKCALAIIITLGTWFLSTTTIMLARHGMAGRGLVVSLEAVRIILLVTSTVIGVIGVIEYSRRRRYVRGRKRAIFAIVCNCLAITFTGLL